MFKILFEIVIFGFEISAQTVRPLVNSSDAVAIGIDDAARAKYFLRLSKYL